MTDLLWPAYTGPGDLATIEAVPLADRGLPGTTYELLARAAELAGVAAPVNGSLSEETVRELLTRSSARVLVTAGPELAPLIWRTAHELAAAGQVDAVLVLQPTGATEAPGLPVVDGVHVGSLSQDAEREPHDGFVGQRPSATDVAALFHTGGTTGTPKLAAHTHANEVVDAWMIAATGTMREDSGALPLFHVNALVVTLLAPLFKGLRVVWAGPLGYRDPVLHANLWMLVEGYGLTEATCASALSHPGHTRAGSVGQRLPYQEMKAVRVTAEGEWVDLPPGQVGVLAIKGPTVFPGYLSGRGPDGPVLDGMGKLHDGWLDTGDLAHLDDDGFVHLTGRAKDLIIGPRHGRNPSQGSPGPVRGLVAVRQAGDPVNTTTILATLLAVAFTMADSAKLAAVPAMRARAEHVGWATSCSWSAT